MVVLCLHFGRFVSLRSIFISFNASAGSSAGGRVEYEAKTTQNAANCAPFTFPLLSVISIFTY